MTVISSVMLSTKLDSHVFISFGCRWGCYSRDDDGGDEDEMAIDSVLVLMFAMESIKRLI